MWPGFTYSMPIPDLSMPDHYSEERFLNRARPKLEWSLWPRRCHVSGKWLCFTPAYRADYVITGPGDPAVWTRWYSSEEMLVLKLKGY
jgi:hypothetical protein